MVSPRRWPPGWSCLHCGPWARERAGPRKTRAPVRLRSEEGEEGEEEGRKKKEKRKKEKSGRQGHGGSHLPVPSLDAAAEADAAASGTSGTSGPFPFPISRVLAPMVGGSELAFRMLCRRYRPTPRASLMLVPALVL